MSSENQDPTLTRSKLPPEEKLKEFSVLKFMGISLSPDPPATSPRPPSLLLTLGPPPNPLHGSRAVTLFSSLMLLDHVDFALGRKENVTSLKYLFSKSGHTLRMLTTSSATSSSSGAVFRPSRKCRRVRFPPLSEKDRRGRSAGNSHTALRARGDKQLLEIALGRHSCNSSDGQIARVTRPRDTRFSWPGGGHSLSNKALEFHPSIAEWLRKSPLCPVGHLSFPPSSAI